MMGDRYGEVVKVPTGPRAKYVHVKMDRSGRTLRVTPDRLMLVNGTRPTVALWVCVCCFIAHVNGDGCPCGDDEEQHPAGLMGEFEGMEVTTGMLYSEHESDCLFRTMGGDTPGNYECECETINFSHSPCDGCGTHLYGERHAVGGWLKEWDR
jgi:hypothetical protein